MSSQSHIWRTVTCWNLKSVTWWALCAGRRPRANWTSVLVLSLLEMPQELLELSPDGQGNFMPAIEFDPAHLGAAANQEFA